MSTKDYIFENPTLYNFDSDLIEIIDKKIKLKLKNNPNQDFTQNFSSDEGFTYDDTKAEFSSGLCRQVNNRVANATFGATYTNTINGSWGNGILTGTAYNGASVSGGKLDLTGSTKYVEYFAIENFNSIQEGCIKFEFYPNYNGYPISTFSFFSIHKQNGSLINLIFLTHNSAGNIILSIYNSSSVAIINSVNLGKWNQNKDQKYEFEFNYNLTLGETRLFIDGVQFGPTLTQTGIRDSNILLFKIGADYNGSNKINGYFDNLIFFSTVQHTENYTPGYILLESDYLETIITCPAQSYNYHILSFAVPIIVEVNAPHYIINGYYWNGSSWVASSNTYATAMSSASWISNIASFPESQLSTAIIIKIIFQGSNILSSIDNISFIINEYTYVTSNVILPEMEYTGVGTLISFDDFISTETGLIKYTLQIGRTGNYLYWDGTNWVTSDGTYEQATTKADFIAHKDVLPVLGKIHGQFKIHFTNINTQSSIDILTISLTAQIYSINNPIVSFLESFENEGLQNFIEISSKTGLDQVKYILSKDENYYYYNGTIWTVSNQTYSQSNTAIEIKNNLITFDGISTNCYIKMFLHSENGITTPRITSINITYGILPIEKCTIYGFCYDEEGNPIEGVIIKSKLVWPFYFYDDFLLFNFLSDISGESNENGYWTLDLIKNTHWTFSFIFDDNKIKRYTRIIPEDDYINFVELEDI